MIVRVAAVAAVWLLVACGDDAPPPPRDAAIAREQVALVPVTENRDLDVLFVIDNSTAFLDSQSALAAAFPAFIDELSQRSGLPSLHLGVITSDVGTLGALDTQPGPDIGNGPGSCAGTGDAGALQTQGSTLLTGAFISDLANTDGTRTRNYAASLADVFSAIARVGSAGCGFEQHLHATRLALDGNPANAGFLRPGAGLALIIFADEDDCSFAHSTFVGDDPTLGPLTSFRCAQFGVRCDEGGTTIDDLAMPGVKTGCSSNEDSPQIVPLGDYAAFLRGLKADPRTVSVSTISGDATPFEVIASTPPDGGTPQPRLANLCTAFDAIAPGVRLSQLPRMFERGHHESICTTDLAAPLAAIARQLRGLAGDACLTREIALPADCEVFDQTRTSEVPPARLLGLDDHRLLRARRRCGVHDVASPARRGHAFDAAAGRHHGARALHALAPRALALRMVSTHLLGGRDPTEKSMRIEPC